jgi:glutathione S-transferase
MPLERPRLIGSSTSPFVRKVRVMLIEKSIEHDFELAPAWNPASPANELNPLQKVPVLEWPGRGVWFDSRVIAQALEAWVPAPALWPANPDDRLSALQLEALADGVADAAALLTQESWRPEAARSSAWVERQTSKIRRGLQTLDRSEAVQAAPRASVPTVDVIASLAAWDFTRYWQPALAEALPLPALRAAALAFEGRTSWTMTAPWMPEGAKPPRL